MIEERSQFIKTGWKIIARGKVKRGFSFIRIGGKLLGDLIDGELLKNEGKNIEIAIRKLEIK